MDVQSWNIVFLDKLVFESKMYLHYNQYLHNTRAHREVSKRDHSVIQYNNPDEDEKTQSHFISIDDLIPDFDMMERFQIYELNLVFTNSELLKVSFIPSISFIDEDVNANNDIYLWNWTGGDIEFILKDDSAIVINDANIGLSYYNYHLLHCDPDHMPKIEIVYSTSNVVVGDDDSAHLGQIDVRYTTLFKKETDRDPVLFFVQKRDPDVFFEFADSNPGAIQIIMEKQEFVQKIIDWIIEITDRITKKYPQDFDKDKTSKTDVDVQTLNKLVSTQYFDKQIKWPNRYKQNNSNKKEISLIGCALERKLLEVTRYLRDYWNFESKTGALEQQKLEQLRREQQQKLEQQRLEQKRERQRLEKERLKREQQKLEQQRMEQQRLEQKRERQRLEKERLKRERIEQENIAKQMERERQRLEKERLKLEQQKLEQQRIEHENIAKQMERERQRLEKEQLEQQRIEQEQLEQLQREQQQKAEQQRLEQQRLEQQKLEQ
eukprot:712560_1